MSCAAMHINQSYAVLLLQASINPMPTLNLSTVNGMANAVEGRDQNPDPYVEPVKSLIGDRRQFARDVGVNVIANLVAAALTASTVYLVGVLLGVFSVRSWALLAAL